MRDTAIRHNNVTWCQSVDVPAAHDDAAASEARCPDVSESDLRAVGADGTVGCVKQCCKCTDALRLPLIMLLLKMRR